MERHISNFLIVIISLEDCHRFKNLRTTTVRKCWKYYAQQTFPNLRFFDTGYLSCVCSFNIRSWVREIYIRIKTRIFKCEYNFRLLQKTWHHTSRGKYKYLVPRQHLIPRIWNCTEQQNFLYAFTISFGSTRDLTCWFPSNLFLMLDLLILTVSYPTFAYLYYVHVRPATLHSHSALM